MKYYGTRSLLSRLIRRLRIRKGYLLLNCSKGMNKEAREVMK